MAEENPNVHDCVLLFVCEEADRFEVFDQWAVLSGCLYGEILPRVVATWRNPRSVASKKFRASVNS